MDLDADPYTYMIGAHPKKEKIIQILFKKAVLAKASTAYFAGCYFMEPKVYTIESIL